MEHNLPDALGRGGVLADRYVIGKIIGSGGFGITYLAFDTEMGGKVAVKEYFPRGAAVRGSDNVTVEPISQRFEEDFLRGKERFFSEAKTLLKLRDKTDVINIYDTFEENGTAYYVMEYIGGITLCEYVRKFGRISEGQAVHIAVKIVSALAGIHENSIIHRDITPENIVLSKDGEAKLVDFGNARLFSFDENSFTVTLKTGYAPLEQYQHYGEQGPWTDIYSLGAVLYFALTLKDPESPMNRVEDDMEFQVGLSSIDPRLAVVIRRMTAVKAKERYAKGAELLAELSATGIAPRGFENIPVD